MRRMVLPVLLFLGAIAVGGWYWWQGRARPLVLSGTIEARDIEVGSLEGGRVAGVHAEEGVEVGKGDLLVTFETDFLDLEIREQEARVAETEARLARTLEGPRSEELRRARIALDDAERERRRMASLLGDGVVGQQAYDRAEAAAQTARETWEEARRGSRREDISEALAACEREKGRLALLQRRRKEQEVRAPVGGVVEVLDLRPGDLVPAGRPVAKILESDQIWVRVYVPETRLALVRLGQEAAVRVDTFPGREFPGRVAEIRMKGEYTPRNIQTLEERMDLVFGVKVAIEPGTPLRPGMAALVRLEEGAPP